MKRIIVSGIILVVSLPLIKIQLRKLPSKPLAPIKMELRLISSDRKNGILVLSASPLIDAENFELKLLFRGRLRTWKGQVGKNTKKELRLRIALPHKEYSEAFGIATIISQSTRLSRICSLGLGKAPQKSSSGRIGIDFKSRRIIEFKGRSPR
jgi:hypothetical protein